MKAETKPAKSTPRKVKVTRGEVGDIDSASWRYFQNKLKVDQVKILEMKQARCPAKVNDAPAYLFRYFNRINTDGQGLDIKDYQSLDEHPELILYDGYKVLGRGGETVINKYNGPGDSIIEEKIRKGEITEKGLVIERTRGQKFLTGFGNFLMMGGFLLVIVVVIAIILAISLMTKSC